MRQESIFLVAKELPTIYDSQPPVIDVLHRWQSLLLPLRVLRSKHNMKPQQKSNIQTLNPHLKIESTEIALAKPKTLFDPSAQERPPVAPAPSTGDTLKSKPPWGDSQMLSTLKTEKRFKRWKVSRYVSLTQMLSTPCKWSNNKWSHAR